MNIRDCVTLGEKNCRSEKNEWKQPDAEVHTDNYAMQLIASLTAVALPTSPGHKLV